MFELLLYLFICIQVSTASGWDSPKVDTWATMCTAVHELLIYNFEISDKSDVLLALSTNAVSNRAGLVNILGLVDILLYRRSNRSYFIIVPSLYKSYNCVRFLVGAIRQTLRFLAKFQVSCDSAADTCAIFFCHLSASQQHFPNQSSWTNVEQFFAHLSLFEIGGRNSHSNSRYYKGKSCYHSRQIGPWTKDNRRFQDRRA